ncbi:MAG: penicillin-binding protein 2 [Candidatus Nanoarchaeia archaeon]|nr:penicillin-binding protein 2 [Candidatus Jingweiarchaeum tengchongense]
MLKDKIITESEVKNFYKVQYILVFLLTIGVFLIIVIRLYKIQVKMGEYYYDRAEKNFIQEIRLSPLRGRILDRKGNVLAQNRPSFNLFLTPAFVKNYRRTLEIIDNLIGIPEEKFDDIIQEIKRKKGLERFKPIKILTDLNFDQVAIIESNYEDLSGVEVLMDSYRDYPLGDIASHIVGYVGEIDKKTLTEKNRNGEIYKQGDIIGKRGIEYAYEDYLRGEEGKEYILVDAKGFKVDTSEVKDFLKEKIKKFPASQGADVYLTIDLEYQLELEKMFDILDGGLIAINPMTGKIYALISRPSFSPSKLSQRISRTEWNKLINDPLKPLVNKVTQDHYPPGSTFKIVSALAALDKKVVNEHTISFCNGIFQFGTRPFRCWAKKGHGGVDIHRAIVQSCDIYFYRLGDKLDIDNIHNYAKLLGFGLKTGLEIDEETPGILPNKEYYKKSKKFGTYHKGYAINAAIGQGDVAVSLIQLAFAYAAIANGGRHLKPIIVEEIRDRENKIILKNEPTIINEINIDKNVLKTIVDGLYGVTTESGGTATYQRYKIFGNDKRIKIAGKTGTAQVVEMREGKNISESYMHKDHAWFVAYADIENPEILVAVLHKHGGHGAAGASPYVFKAIKLFYEKFKGMKFEDNISTKNDNVSFVEVGD